ncbi:hypothetical protein V6N12_069355 [Hibiscus sabdariffa]|uniref:Uncharacterized protein n=1 Tax=Hibiscus sabdariffa TaxID=183260 RepID=A0ABR2FDQ7_9ROSI
MSLPPEDTNFVQDFRPEKFGSHGGRPSNGHLVINTPVALERSSSAVATEDLRNHKKGRVSMLEDDNSTMDEDGGVDRSVLAGEGHDGGGNLVSYANMVTKLPGVSSNGNEGLGVINEEVVVADDDVSIDRSRAYPLVRFFEKVHDQIDRNMRNVIIVRLLEDRLVIKQRRNEISALKVDDVWCQDQGILRREARDFFQTLFTSNCLNERDDIRGLFPTLSPTEAQGLDFPVTVMEIRMPSLI